MSRHTHRVATTLVDLACILAALSCAGMWAGHGAESPTRIATEVTLLTGMFWVVWFAITKRLGTHSVPPRRNLSLSLRRTAEAWAATWGIAGLLAVSTVAHETLHVWLALLTGMVCLGSSRVLLSLSPAVGAGDRVRAAVIGACPSARALTTTPAARESIDFVGFVPFAHEDPTTMPHLPPLGQLANLSETLRLAEVDMVFVSPSDAALSGEVHRAIDVCDALGLQAQYFPAFLDVDHLHVGMTWSENRPGLNVHPMAESTLPALGKRLFDVACAALGLLALAPVFIACGAAVKLTSRGPVFFRQTRVGKSGRTFSCLKFRTMRVGAHAMQELLRPASQQDGPAFKMSDDPRITPVGRILRKFSLDELPQLINVLFGDMSIVGPRPPIPSEVAKYTWWQRRRISVKPGLTCVWQVYGRNRVSFKRWVEMDLFYIDNWSLWLDLKLIAHTFRAVMSGTGM